MSSNESVYTEADYEAGIKLREKQILIILAVIFILWMIKK
jgi:hypothetical protein